MTSSICHHFLAARSRPSQQAAFKFKRQSLWNSLTWTEAFSQSSQLALALQSLGLSWGDRVAILSATRYEWGLFDMATMGCGAVTVPIYQSTLPEELAYILNNCQAKILVLEDLSQWEKWQKVQSTVPSVEQVILLEGEVKSSAKKWIGYSRLLQEGQELESRAPEEFAKSIQKIKPSDLATIIYTSGTTGQPKGVVLTHTQIMSEVTEAFSAMGVGPEDSSLIFLPLAHVLGRVEFWGSIYWGYSLAFAQSIEGLRQNLQEIQPSIMVAVPRIFEKFHASILSELENRPFWQKTVFDWALSAGGALSQKQMAREALGPIELGAGLLAQNWLLQSVAKAFGGRLRFAVCGGAPLNPTLAEFFHSAGLLILEGYGLTETTAAVTVNTPFAYRFGTVGKPIGDVEIQLAEDGEILIRSQKVMKEYYADPEATAQALTQDGFLATGDVGELSPEGFLRITDRKKDLIKTSGGKYVAPQKLENLLKLHPMVGHVHIHGDQRKYVVALITLNEAMAAAFARQEKISFQNFEALSQHPKIHDLIVQAVNKANEKLADHESIKNFAILPHDFSIERGELTPSLKVKRKICDERYQDILNRLYA